MNEEYFVSSLVGHVAPDQLEQACASIKEIPYAEVPLSDDRGKIVVLVDAPSLSDLLETTDKIREITGMYSLLPVYQHEEKSQ